MKKNKLFLNNLFNKGFKGAFRQYLDIISRLVKERDYCVHVRPQEIQHIGGKDELHNLEENAYRAETLKNLVANIDQYLEESIIDINSNIDRKGTSDEQDENTLIRLKVLKLLTAETGPSLENTIQDIKTILKSLSPTKKIELLGSFAEERRINLGVIGFTTISITVFQILAEKSKAFNIEEYFDPEDTSPDTYLYLNDMFTEDLNDIHTQIERTFQSIKGKDLPNTLTSLTSITPALIIRTPLVDVLLDVIRLHKDNLELIMDNSELLKEDPLYKEQSIFRLFCNQYKNSNKFHLFVDKLLKSDGDVADKFLASLDGSYYDIVNSFYNRKDPYTDSASDYEQKYKKINDWLKKNKSSKSLTSML